MAKRELIAKIHKQYRKVGVYDDIPIIFASSMPVGAMLAPILAHTSKLTEASIAQACEEATTLALSPPNVKLSLMKLVEKHKNALSHNNKGGVGAYCYQPGGSMGMRLLKELRLERGWWANSRGLNFTRGMIMLVGTEHVRQRIHTLFQRRVRYHIMLNYLQWGMLGDHMMCWPNKRFCVVCEKPRRLLLNNNRRAHSTEKAAIRFKDGWAIAAVNGIRVPLQYVKNRNLLTADTVLKEPNVEVKRALIELMGYEQWIKTIGEVQLHNDVDQDRRPRKLWHLGAVNLNVLEVFNSTPEPDGTFKKYFLQVPGNITSVNSALAWMLDDRLISLNSLEMRIET